LLSSDVVQVSGDGHCALGSTCESVRLKVGDTMRLTYTNGVTYAVKLASTHVVTSASVPPGSK
ncbi:MAG: hypothetical protein QOE29_1790, partial [Gaiellaceae bacterium]|nr:hypothetical protein [Gaiellaceae bacterium]